MDFLKLLNGVIGLAKPVSAELSYAQTTQDQLADLNLDSLDTIMLAMYMGEIYGIDEETMRSMSVATVADLLAFLEANKTRTPTNAEAELARVK